LCKFVFSFIFARDFAIAIEGKYVVVLFLLFLQIPNLSMAIKKKSLLGFLLICYVDIISSEAEEFDPALHY